MRRFISVLIIFSLILTLTGNNNLNIPLKKMKEEVTHELQSKPIIGQAFPSNDFRIQNLKRKKKLTIIPQNTADFEKGASGITTDRSFHGLEGRVYSEAIDSFNLVYSGNTGSEWNGRHIYIVDQAPSSSDSGHIIVFDPEYGTVEDYWQLPFPGWNMGIAVINNALYVNNYSNDLIRKVDLSTHNLVYQFSEPTSNATSGMSSDGQNLFICTAFSGDTLYHTDTLGNIIDSWYIGSFCSNVRDLAYVGRDNSIWISDEGLKEIIHVDLNGPSAVLLDNFPIPVSTTVEGISFDGSDLWYNGFYNTNIYRIDGGYSHARIALFQDNEPWGFRAVKDILYDYGIPFKIFTSGDIGKVDLSLYTKAIIPGQQDREMGDSIATYRTWWENWINSGGVLQISAATYTIENWEGLTLPGDFSCESFLSDTLNISSNWHPLVNLPNDVDSAEIQGWGSSTHGCLTGLYDHYTVIEDSIGRPTLAIKRLGDGGIITTTITVEYAWGYGLSDLLNDLIHYWKYGVINNVLFALSDVDMPWMREAIMTRDSITKNVDYMDARSTFPNVEDFNMYDVVLTYPNMDYYNNIAMGDTLAAYLDSGRSVVTCGWSWFTAGNHLDGAIMNSTYNPFYNYSASGGNHYFSSNLGWYDGAHPFINGITTFSGFFRDSLAVNPGADTVAKYTDGEYLLGLMEQPTGGVVVGFNAVPFDSSIAYWNGQMVKLLRNILNNAATAGIDEISLKDNLEILEISSPIINNNGWIKYSLDSPGKLAFRIINAAGMVVNSRTLHYRNSGVKKIDFDVSEFPSGSYFLHLNSENKTGSKKVVILR